MIRAILFDLDNTLLENGMEQFVPAYLDALSKHMADLVPPKEFVRHLLRATDAMTKDADPSRTNMEAFDAVFFPALGQPRQELEPHFASFYATQFPNLRSLTRAKPTARPLIEWAFAQSLQVVIATNPLFPLTAIEQRLEWAQVPVDTFPFHLVTSYENMHATKPHTAYYQEIAQQIGQQVEACIVVGDDWQMDIQPAARTGMHTYWIAEPGQSAPTQEPQPAGKGSLADFATWIQGQLA